MRDFINLIWSWLKNQSPDVVRIICIGLILWILGNYTISGVKDIFNDHDRIEELSKRLRENYTVLITPEVNTRIKDIVKRDPNASNVILLNYHNTLLSSHGLSYKYLTAICELFKGIDSKPCVEHWKELDYMNYGEEIHKININSYMLISDIGSYREEFPKFTYLLECSNFKAAAFYPLEGVNGTVGMIIVGYTDSITDINIEYIRSVIAPNIQPLSTLLDYDYIQSLKLKNENR